MNVRTLFKTEFIRGTWIFKVHCYTGNKLSPGTHQNRNLNCFVILATVTLYLMAEAGVFYGDCWQKQRATKMYFIPLPRYSYECYVLRSFQIRKFIRLQAVLTPRWFNSDFFITFHTFHLYRWRTIFYTQWTHQVIFRRTLYHVRCTRNVYKVLKLWSSLYS